MTKTAVFTHQCGKTGSVNSWWLSSRPRCSYKHTHTQHRVSAEPCTRISKKMTKTWGTAWRQSPFLSSLQLLLSQEPQYGGWQAYVMCLAVMTLNIVVHLYEEPQCFHLHPAHRNSLFRATQSQYMCLSLSVESMLGFREPQVFWSQSHWWSRPAIKLPTSNYEQKPSWVKQSVVHRSYLEVIMDSPLLLVPGVMRQHAALQPPEDVAPRVVAP